MKKYKVNEAIVRGYKNGCKIKWEYAGKTDDYKAKITELEKSIEYGCTNYIGIRITDTETNEVIFEKIYK